MADVPILTLKPKRERRISEGHPWVFSNEIDSDLKAIEPGATVDVFDARGKFMGRGYCNPHSLIAVRILSRRRKEDIDAVPFYAQRLRDAQALRDAVCAGRQSLRLVYGEGDQLPGLVVDRYDDVLAVQITTMGMEVRKPLLQEALQQVYGPRAAVLRNDLRVRDLEGLPRGREVWFGDAPDTVTFDEAGVRFELPLLEGQKTGHFFDQFANKRHAAALCAGRTVLDVYANTGGWALHALAAGAEHAIVIDSDEGNCTRALHNAALNGVAERMEAIPAEAKRTLQEMVALGRRFGAVVLDPPAFAKTRKTAGQALKGYREINAIGSLLVEEGGLLFTSSCSYHAHEDRFLDAIVQGARDADRKLVLVHRGEQAPDHPIRPEIPETRYLKSYAFRVTTL